jgi:pullulanase/glycogen debranching enzyme
MRVPIGRPYPSGATVCADGTNVSIFSASGCGMQLVLFNQADDGVASRAVTLDPERSRTAGIFCLASNPDNSAAIRADGPFVPQWESRTRSREMSTAS